MGCFFKQTNKTKAVAIGEREKRRKESTCGRHLSFPLSLPYVYRIYFVFFLLCVGECRVIVFLSFFHLHHCSDPALSPRVFEELVPAATPRSDRRPAAALASLYISGAYSLLPHHHSYFSLSLRLHFPRTFWKYLRFYVFKRSDAFLIHHSTPIIGWFIFIRSTRTCAGRFGGPADADIVAVYRPEKKTTESEKKKKKKGNRRVQKVLRWRENERAPTRSKVNDSAGAFISRWSAAPAKDTMYYCRVKGVSPSGSPSTADKQKKRWTPYSCRLTRVSLLSLWATSCVIRKKK